jgi:DNA/RNA endonuclease G (NUC1)
MGERSLSMSPGRSAAGSFESLSALQVAHSELMTPRSEVTADEGGSVKRLEAIKSFIDRAQESGAFLKERGERREAQQIIDYWTAELVSEDDSAERRKLKDFEERAVDLKTRQIAEDALGKDREDNRQLVRLAATARLWLSSDKNKGYLLTGDALTQARRFHERDSDVDSLLEASEVEATRQTRRFRVSAGAAFLVLIMWLAAVTILWLRAQDRAEYAEKQRQIAVAEKGELSTALEEKQRETANAKMRLQELDQKQRQLDAAIALIAGLEKKGVIRTDELSPSIKPLVEAANAPDRIATTGAASDPSIAGYDANFLATPLPLPAMSPAMTQLAFAGGKPLTYVNYSLVLNAKRRLAFFSASNLDRERRRVLPRGSGGFTRDPRVPAAAQPSPSFFAANDIDRGHLVTRQEISWGPYFSGPEAVAATRLQAMVDIYTNVTPQYDTFNQGVWSELERWVLTDHNKNATKVAIFTGPVLTDDDPIIDGVQIPRRFWKIAVSARDDFGGGLIVDAFVIAQIDGKGDKIGIIHFLPSVFRARVSDIELLTGLDFGQAVRDADQVNQPPRKDAASPGDTLAALARTLDSPDADQRASALQKIVAAIRDTALPEEERRKVVAALVDIGRSESIQALSPIGRRNLLSALAEVPRTSWDQPGWSDLRATARRAVGDVERRAALVQASFDGEMRQALDELKRSLRLGDPPNVTVEFQFAGMTREEAVEISQRLKALGWKITGEERTGAAAGQNEVRYGAEADKADAELLISDLKALGLAKVCCAKRNPNIKPGFVEIWISR